MKPTKVKIKGGEIHPYSKKYYDKNLEIMEGKDMMLNLIEPEKQRSIDANRYYWFLLNEISSYSGHHQNKLHKLFKYEFLRSDETIMGIEVIEIKSTRGLSVKSFYEYCERITAFMSDFGFVVPSIEDWDKIR